MDLTDNIINWNTFEGEECIIDGIVMKRVEDFGYGEPHYYYTDVPREPFIAHNFLAVINGKISSDVDKKNTKKYMKQLNDIFGRKEKNYLLRAWQNQSKTQGVVNVYNKSDGFLQSLYPPCFPLAPVIRPPLTISFAIISRYFLEISCLAATSLRGMNSSESC